MKCPKCSYLGFETGDRCKNCGYDFSLLAAPHAEPPDPDLNLQVPDDLPAEADRSWMDRLHSGVDEVAEAHEMPEPALGRARHPAHDARASGGRSYRAGFPLFDASREEEDDEPLIKFPAAPRAPLSVRRTPEQPRLRPPGRPAHSDSPPLSLEFAEELVPTPEPELHELIERLRPIEPRRRAGRASCD